MTGKAKVARPHTDRRSPSNSPRTEDDPHAQSKPRSKSEERYWRRIELGRLMKGTREKNQIPMEALRRLMGIRSRSTIGNWERGDIQPMPDKLALYCRALVSLGCSRFEAIKIFEHAYEWISLLLAQDAEGDGMDDLPHRWMKTNHSHISILWLAAKPDVRRSVQAIISSHYSKVLSGVASVQFPDHAISSDAYWVESIRKDHQSLFLKRYRYDQRESQLRSLFSAYRCVAQAKIFPTLGEYLAPVLADDGGSWVRDLDDRLVVAYPFIRGAADGSLTHFAGQHLGEVRDVGLKLGLINQQLETLPSTRDDRYARAEQRCAEVLKAIETGWAVPNRSQYLAMLERDRLERVYCQVRPLLVRNLQDNCSSAADIHPHNVFIARQSCELIFDFAPRKDWPEVATVAFTMHRMCREFIRRRLRKGESRATFGDTGFGELELRVASEALSAFIEGYGHGRPSLVEPLSSEGAAWATAMNFVKLIDCLRAQALGFQDRYSRTERQLYREIVKFLAYLRECELFERAVKTPF